MDVGLPGVAGEGRYRRDPSRPDLALRDAQVCEPTSLISAHLCLAASSRGHHSLDCTLCQCLQLATKQHEKPGCHFPTALTLKPPVLLLNLLPLA